ncbi:MAG: RagB/SusD family nutrient uptake outer membrane protein [Bacteroidales bacterium 36-12]|nr:MAG: RagB/SusD family nutrient uptake outer membrane protein [Bacteroidales bacterium 36-12]
MKTKLLKYIFLFTFSVVLFSCEFLDNAPDGQVTLEMIFNDKARTEEWLAAVYNTIPDPYTPMMMNYDAYADDYSPSEGWEAFGWDCISKIKGNWNSESPWSGGFWGNLPARIRQAYIFIENVKALPVQGLDVATVENMKAEARFLIAYYYYLMVNSYGAIPLQTRLSDFDESFDELMIGQMPYDDVINWIDDELQAVAKILPPNYDSETQKYGRATSIMALAVRARMLIFAASDLVNGNTDPEYLRLENNKGQKIFNSQYEPKKWERAAIACEELITAAHTAGHQLYTEYNSDGTIDPFMSYSNMNFVEYHQGNKEILFSRSNCDYGWMEGHSAPRGWGGQGGLGVTQTLVDAFFMDNGLPPVLGYDANRNPIFNPVVSGYYSEKGFSVVPDRRKTKWIYGSPDANINQEINTVVPAGIFNMYVHREPRFYVSVYFNGAYYRAAGRNMDFYKNGLDGIPDTSPWDAPQNGYLLRKRIHPNTNIGNNNNIRPYRPGILFRLAEAYLNYAEALNEWNPSQTNDILHYVNLVRERAGIPLYGSGAGQIAVPTDQDGMRDVIRRERRVEFNCEYAIRYDDVRRWKQMDLLKGKFDGMNAKGTRKSSDENDSEAYFVRKDYITRAFSDKNYWIPIHQNQLDKNPNLRQLPYW